ncbi:hypothetical protein [Halobellus rufus]|uniref:hypothetical protein n=1 Tax=Halobellus rufus TaxID=1448860 RepID=UPI0012E0AE5D|nr:hypothetical protein [Halobellus rufus]
MRSFSDPDTEFEIVVAETSEDWDGARRGEPVKMRCPDCGATLPITREPSASIEELPHDPDCPQRGVTSQWWERTFVDDV